MVEISLSGSEGAPGGQLPGATREASISVAFRLSRQLRHNAMGE